MAMARRVNGIKSGIGMSGSAVEAKTRRGFVGLTKNIRCLARVLNENLPDTDLQSVLTEDTTEQQ
jgi:hypothetical protein